MTNELPTTETYLGFVKRTIQNTKERTKVESTTGSDNTWAASFISDLTTVKTPLQLLAEKGDIDAEDYSGIKAELEDLIKDIKELNDIDLVVFNGLNGKKLAEARNMTVPTDEVKEIFFTRLEKIGNNIFQAVEKDKY